MRDARQSVAINTNNVGDALPINNNIAFVEQHSPLVAEVEAKVDNDSEC